MKGISKMELDTISIVSRKTDYGCIDKENAKMLL